MFERYQKNGYRVTFIPVDGEGRLDQEALLESLDDDTAIVSLMWANNETGVINPIDDLSREVRARGILFHTDAVQTVGKIPIDVSRSGVDLLSMSAHKFHGPKGIGALYIRKGTKFKPMVVGGHQEGGRRAGTENVPGIVGMGQACALAGKNLGMSEPVCGSCATHLEQALLKAVPRSMANGGQAERLPNTTSIAFEYVEGEAILLMMNEYGICASSGSACTSGSLEPSHVLRAMGVPFTAAHGSIRYSLSHYTTGEEIDFIVDKMPPIIERLRSMSPFWKQAAEAAFH